MTKGRILIVDDDPVVRDSLSQWFQSEDYETGACDGAASALAELARHSYEVALLDIKMPGVDGIELQHRLRELEPDMPVIIMTGYATVETAVRALKNGAYDYITKPFDPDELVHLVERALAQRAAVQEVDRLRESLTQMNPARDLIGASPAMRRVNELVQTVAPTDATVLITGESGTGKEVVARAVHAASPRRLHPLVAIHCGALTDSLLESELFGHEKGAFTGAHARKKGKFEVADGGTVFLDEIADISLHTQTDLLRVLQEKEITRVGGTQTLKVDFRAIVATNKRLEKLVEEGTFRPDLYYRLNVFTIDIPPLRSRREDIPLLIEHFLDRFAVSMNRPRQKVLPATVEMLIEYAWPGNVRELENAIERALLICRERELPPEAFPFQAHPITPAAEGRSLDEIEKHHIAAILSESQWNLSRAARILDIDRTTLYNKIRRYSLQEE
ncbi:MAG: sigma-54-dependent Fis family transcriptional regulator [Bryobacterales bacterium]|nr:sigma-54-dependent Fis family transcriptional regulator [Bryobacterales bacterium]